MEDRLKDVKAKGWFDKEFLDKNVFDAAVERAIYCLETFEDYYVSFSGGKDSTAILQVVLAAAEAINMKEPLKVLYFDEEVVDPKTDEYVKRCVENMNIDMHWYCLPVLQRNACSLDYPMWYPWGPEVKHKWVRDMPLEATHTLENVPWFPKEIADRPTLAAAGPYFFADWGDDIFGQKKCVIFLGIRVAESMMRRMIIANHKDNHDHWLTHVSLKNLKFCSKAYPIFDWTDQDVWTGPKKLGWDYNAIYDQLEMIGLPPSAQRIGTPFGEEPLRGLWHWQITCPEIWDKMSTRVDGAAAAMRYAQTSLWGKGESKGRDAGLKDMMPSLGEGQTYSDLLREQMMMYQDESMRTKVAQTIKTELARHYRITKDPIVVWTAHPISGVSWLRLMKLVLVGDVKNRNKSSRVNVKQGLRLIEQYHEELEKHILEGTVDVLK